MSLEVIRRGFANVNHSHSTDDGCPSFQNPFAVRETDHQMARPDPLDPIGPIAEMLTAFAKLRYTTSRYPRRDN
jgi:hypothetical protein